MNKSYLGVMFLKIKEYLSGATKIELYDDFIPTQKEVLEKKQEAFKDLCNYILIASEKNKTEEKPYFDMIPLK